MSAQVKNMDCQDIKALLSALVDDRVDAEARHSAERHLAGCSMCRSLLDEAEALDDLISRDANGFGSASSLPPGFAASVLERASIVRPTLKRTFITWTGWTAAAACLVLAVMIWSFDRQNFMKSGSPMAAGTNPAGANSMAKAPRSGDGLVQRATYERRSWTYDGDFADDSQNSTNSNDTAVVTTLDKIKQPTIDPAFAAQDSFLTLDDAQTLYSVAMLMETLESADLSNFEQIERIRQVAEYDNLLPRLDSMKSRLSTSDRPMITAAECILLRIVRGPVTLQDARELLTDASGLRLARYLHSISMRNAAGNSL